MGELTKLDLLHLLGHHGHYFESACYHLDGVPHAGLYSPGISHSSAMRGLFGQRVQHSTKALLLVLVLVLLMQRRVRHSTNALSLVLGLLLLQRRVWHSTDGALPLVLLLALLARRAGPLGLLLFRLHLGRLGLTVGHRHLPLHLRSTSHSRTLQRICRPPCLADTVVWQAFCGLGWS